MARQQALALIDQERESLPNRDALSRRADYTFSFNSQSGRHGWLRLTPAYSVKIVDDILSSVSEDPERRIRVFDPFCGSATTALSAAYHGHQATTIDINPFLVWFGQTKTAHYDPATLDVVREDLVAILQVIATGPPSSDSPPPIHNLARWWTPEATAFLLNLRAAIRSVTEPASPARNLLQIAFCRTLIACSNAAFNHQSMSFKTPVGQRTLGDEDLRAFFQVAARDMVDSAGVNPPGTASVLLGDARDPASAVSSSGLFDLVITSPPYANRMSYIRELRPYMYWLGYLHDGRDAGELDWSAIGGTWGIATSRLNGWSRGDHGFTDKRLTETLEKIARHDKKSAPTLAAYVARYLDDIWTHFQALPALLAPGASVHYIVGNSTFYDILLPVEQFYVEMLKRLGFRDVIARPIRKRNSKKALVEFDVSAVWPR